MNTRDYNASTEELMLGNYRNNNLNSQGIGNKKVQYLKDLQCQINEKKMSKVEMYREKLLERAQDEKYNMNDCFGKAGNGAPLRDHSGNIVTSRKAISTDNIYARDITANTINPNDKISHIAQNPYPYNFNPTQYPFYFPTPYPYQLPLMQYHPYASQYSFPRHIPMSSYTPWILPRVSPHNFESSSGTSPRKQNSFSPLAQRKKFTGEIHLDQTMPNQNCEKPAQQEINNNNDDLKGIVPQEKRDEKSEQQKKLWQGDLFRQIEEKKRRDAENKRKEIEMDRVEEEKFQIYLQKKKEQEIQQQLKKRSKLNSNAEGTNNIPATTNPPNKSNIIKDKPANEIKEEKNIELSFPRYKSYEEELKANEEFKRMIEMKYENLHKTLNDDMDQQIIKLKSDVNVQYVEMGGIFDQLRHQTKDATVLRNQAERQLSQIQEEIEKRKPTGRICEDKNTERTYGRHITEANQEHSLGVNSQRKNRHLNLKSTSTMIYNNEELGEEEVRGNQLSSLAQVGQSLIGESAFIPISDKAYDTHSGKNIVLDRGGYEEMYSKLNEIADLSTKMDQNSKHKEAVGEKVK